MDNCIRVSGKGEKGPWDVQRIENGLLHSGIKTAQSFEELCSYVGGMIKGRNLNYAVEYQGDNPVLSKFEQEVLSAIVEMHNAPLEEIASVS